MVRPPILREQKVLFLSPRYSMVIHILPTMADAADFYLSLAIDIPIPG
jgi:hypothetical protein